jgi:hypothetical protein
MSDLYQDVQQLSQEIGPRPAATEEEQRAALYISKQFSSRTGFETTVEDFTCNAQYQLPQVISIAVAVVVSLFAIILPVLSIPALVVDVVVAALMVLTVLGKSVFDKLPGHGMSQNIIAKYQPEVSPHRPTRRRKVIVVANYDTDRVKKQYDGPLFKFLPLIYRAEAIALVLLPLWILARVIIDPHHINLIIFNVVEIILLLIAVLPCVSFILEKQANYSEGANCNASGVATLLEVAERVAYAQDSSLHFDVSIHGEEAVREAGLIPDDVEVDYQISPEGACLDPTLQTANERLQAAKDAIAALSGEAYDSDVSCETQHEIFPKTPVEHILEEEAVGDYVPANVEQQAKESADVGNVIFISDSGFKQNAAAVAAGAQITDTVNSFTNKATQSASQPAVPDWFTKAQEQAKKPKGEARIQRSRYAQAFDHAEEEIAAQEAAQDKNLNVLEKVNTPSSSLGAATPVELRSQDFTNSNAAPSENTRFNMPEAAESCEVHNIHPSVTPEDKVSQELKTETPYKALNDTDDIHEVTVRPSRGVTGMLNHSSSTYRNEAESQNQNRTQNRVAVEAPAEDLEVFNVTSNEPSTAENTDLNNTIPAVPSIPSLNLPSLSASDAPKESTLTIPSVENVSHETSQPTHKRQRAISLPDIGVSQELPRISLHETHQAAPLNEEPVKSNGRVHDLSAIIPSVSSAPEVVSTDVETPSNTIAVPEVTSPALSGSINLAGTFSSLGATGAAAPITDDLIEDVNDEDLYVEDADDSAYLEQVTETGAITGPGYVEMPQSRFGRLFGKFKKKNKNEAPQQSWSQFENEFTAEINHEANDEFYDESYDNDYYIEEEAVDYNTSLEGATTAFNPLTDAEAYEYPEDTPPEASSEGAHGRHRRYEGGVFSRSMMKSDAAQDEFDDYDQPKKHHERASVFAEGLPANFVFEDVFPEETVSQFHEHYIDVEVWFVALGSELAGNAGMRSFIQKHASELRGAVFLELEGLAGGTLSLIESEGKYLPKKPSSRMKRITQKAGTLFGLKVPTASMEWRDSASACALRHGYQALHLAGIEDGKPAFFAEENDVIENIDIEKLGINSDYVIEVLKHI